MGHDHALWLPIHGLSDEEKMAARAIQGISNRRGPRVWLESRFWNWPEADRHWRNIYETDHGMTFHDLHTLEELADACAGDIGGLAVWDPTLPRTGAVAATLAGLEDLLPATPDLAVRLRRFQVRHDLRGRFADDMAAMEHVVDDLVARCSHGIAYSIAKLWSGLSLDALDYAIMRRAPIYQLSPEEKDHRETALSHRLQECVGPGAAIYGWAEPEERYSMLASMHNNFILCAEAPNLSFHAGAPCDRKEWEQPARRSESEFLLERVHYVAFMTSEGDAPKIHSVFHGGAWMDPERGSVPINWGFQPRLLEIVPAMADYYYRTATTNDFFVCGPSGAGYCYPNVVPEPETFFQETGDFLRRADIDIVECWLHFSRPVYDAYACVSGARGFTLPCGPLGTKFVGDDIPVFLRGSALNYFSAKKGVEGMIRAIVEQGAKQEAPSFNTVFFVPDAGSPTAQGGYGPSQLRRVMEGLPRDRFRVTTLDEMAWAARKARRAGWLKS